MTQDKTSNFADPTVWDEEDWLATDPTIMGSEFSPNMGADILCGSTVSPSEIMNPALLQASPYLFDSPSETGYDTSPLVGGDDFGDAGSWFSLFPEVAESSSAEDTTRLQQPQQPQQQQQQHTNNTNTLTTIISESRESSDSPETSPKSRNVGPGGVHQKRSSTSGVRKRQIPLPPIVVEDPSDVVAMKRMRNTLAARKSRAKKAEKMDEMEAQIDELKREVAYWKSIAQEKGLH